METKKAILGRRAVRDFRSKPVPAAAVKEILKAGAMAPSAKDLRPCRFVVITNRDRIRELSQKVKARMKALELASKHPKRMEEGDTIFHNAPLLILIVAERGTWTEIDCSLAAQNMMLRAYDLGIGSCFIGFAGVLRYDLDTMRSLGVGDKQVLYCSLIFGYPRKWPKAKVREARILKAWR